MCVICGGSSQITKWTATCCFSASWVMATPLPASPQWGVMEEPHTLAVTWIFILPWKPQLQRVAPPFSFQGLHHWFAPKRHFTVLNTPHLWGLCFCSDHILMILRDYFCLIKVIFVVIHIKHGSLELTFHRRRKTPYLSYEDLENKYSQISHWR